ncbi:N-acetylmuramoyl-L-alanine amidase [Paenibacillus eucommiae]|uniref:N-acetylmuramoyl-L-alanine amidase n=1 Tax=Paenibacillus eucommiae TaxID=1355755 RepID=A0ABS4JB81_9BACL|nr:N-acetylmuramoyl-L-alanine amidase [Paenibacillus eucommiae]MBP1996341.1 N-acetylmuramoyl-L-alanine amidase [Paenibacillus eucommiae]
MLKFLSRAGMLSGFVLLVTLLYGFVAQAADYENAVVSADTLSVRDDGSVQGKVVGFLKKGETVRAYEESYGWIRIRSGKLEGWVAGQYLIKSSSSNLTVSKSKSSEASPKKSTDTSTKSQTVSKKSANTGKVTADALRLRTGPSQEHKVITLLSMGTKVDIANKQGEWLQVQVRAKAEEQGWVHSSYIEVGDDKVEIAEAPKDVPEKAVNSGSGIKGKVIVIDPGHGEGDPGTVGVSHETEERNLNMSTSLYLAEELRALGAKVILTRNEKSKAVSLANRVQISEMNKADAFVSVHYNSATVPVSGTLTFYYSEEKDMRLARKIEGRLGKMSDLKSNGISFGDYHVLRNNSRPSVLVELGFLSNPADESIIRTKSYQQKAAKSVAQGLNDYFNE